MKIKFIANNWVEGMDLVIINDKRTSYSIPRWLLNKLEPKDIKIMEMVLCDMIKSGIEIGEKNKSDKINNLIDKIKNEIKI